MGQTKTTGKGSKNNNKKVAVKPPEAPDQVPEIAGSEAAYQKLLPIAEAIEARDVSPLRADVAVAGHNASTGAAAVLEHQSVLAEHLPKVKASDISDIPSIVDAFAFAALRVDHLIAPESGIAELLRTARRTRRLLLSSATALAEAGVLNAKAVQKIIEGRGPMDTAEDCVALAALFGKEAKKLKGKTAVTAAQVKEAAEVGTRLRGVLKPTKAVKTSAPSAELARATDVRDRFWTLLVQRHDIAWRAGAYLFGKDVHDRVPPLHRHAVTRKKVDKAPAAPAPSPA